MPNILERALPTIGAIGGGILGGLGAGAVDVGTLGAAAPLVNPITGAIAGAGLGEAAGKAGQNKMEGQGLGSGVLGAGIEGAASQAVGGAAGSLIGKGGSALLNMAAKGATKRVAQQTAEQLGQESAKSNLFNKTFSGFENATKPMRDFLDTHGINTDLTQAGTGIVNDANELRTRANILPNAIISPFQKIRNEEVLKAAGGDKVQLPSDMFQKFLTNVNSAPGTIGKQHIYDLGATEVSPEEQVAQEVGSSGARPNIKTSGKNPVVNYADDVVTDIANALTSKGLKGEEGLAIAPNGALSGAVSMDHALNILKQISDTVDKHYQSTTDSLGRPLTNAAKSKVAQLSNAVEKDLQDVVYNQPGLSEAVKARAGDAETALRGMLDNAEGTTFSPTTIEKALQTQRGIFEQPDIAGMNGTISPLVNLARMARGAKSVGAKSGKAEQDLLKAASGVTEKNATSLVDTVNPFKSAKAAVLEGAGLTALHPALGLPLLGMGAAQGAKNLPPELLTAAGRGLGSVGSDMGRNVLGSLTAGGASLATQGGSPGAVPMPTNTGAPMQPTAATPGAAAAPINPFMSLIPGSGVSAAYQPVAQEALAGMFDPAMMSNFAGPAATATQGISDKQQAIQQTLSLVNSLKGEYAAAGGGQGRVGGILSQLQGKATGGAAGAYDAEANASATQIAKATGADPSEIRQYIPQLTDTPDVAQTKLNALSQLIQSTGFTGGNVLGSL